MSDSSEIPEVAIPEPQGGKRSRRALVVGLALALVAGAAGFLVTWSGLSDRLVQGWGTAGAPAGGPEDAITFVAIDPVDVAFGSRAGNRRFRFTCALEVREADAARVAQQMPRIRDVLNSYLNAITPEDVEGAAAIARIRAQLLRRIQVVTGADRVRDLLVTEFILT